MMISCPFSVTIRDVSVCGKNTEAVQMTKPGWLFWTPLTPPSLVLGTKTFNRDLTFCIVKSLHGLFAKVVCISNFTIYII